MLSAVSDEEEYDQDIKAEEPLKAWNDYKRPIDPTKAALDKIKWQLIAYENISVLWWVFADGIIFPKWCVQCGVFVHWVCGTCEPLGK